MSRQKAAMFLPIFGALGMNAKIRDDAKIIAIDNSIEGFRDADGDEAIYFILGVPYENLAIITAISLFNAENLSETLKKEIAKLTNQTNIGAYAISHEDKIDWSAQIYLTSNDEINIMNIMSAIKNFRSQLMNLIGVKEEQNSDEELEESRATLEENYQLESEVDCHELELSESPQGNFEKSNNEAIKIELSDKLHPEAKKEVENRFKEVNSYIQKIKLDLPKGYFLRIQHGNNEENVETGFNKGPYICIVDNNGKEKKTMRLFLSRRGNLNSYIAV